MANFMIRFLICNFFISIIIGILIAVKRLFKSTLSSRTQYHLWFLLLGLLAVPFIPLQPVSFLSVFSWIESLKNMSGMNGEPVRTAVSDHISSSTANQLNDFTLSVSSRTPSALGLILGIIWLIGILAMIVYMVKSKIHLNVLKKSALPLQNEEVRNLYKSCLNELKITKGIPVYSTAFLKSPILAGLFQPCIYLPTHLIADYDAKTMRYMLLHELQHYIHKDNFVNYLMNFASILYWFHPFVLYALKEMRNDREIACDTSVLNILEEADYADYGNTLLNFAEKISAAPFPFSTGISGSMKQMTKRILNIATYEKPSVRKRIKDMAIFGITAILLLFLAPALSTYAADENHYEWNTSSERISSLELSAYFDGYEGSFVLYDLEADTWSIYNMERATLRVSPDSTYKIYDALFGLEEGVITPADSLISWNREIYPFEAWNTDQNLYSAMQSSVNWYFQTVDEQLGKSTVYNYIREIGYGNETITGDFSTYWLESSLKISPVEQVELLTKLYSNGFGFSQENMDAVKDSIYLTTLENETLYGKTGTGRINGEDVNGWFVGYVEGPAHTCFFAINMQGDTDASGSIAAETAMEILSDLHVL